VATDEFQLFIIHAVNWHLQAVGQHCHYLPLKCHQKKPVFILQDTCIKYGISNIWTIVIQYFPV